VPWTASRRAGRGRRSFGRSLLDVPVLREGLRLRRAHRFVVFDVRRLCDPALIVVRQLQQPPFDERVGLFRESSHGPCSFPAELVVHAVAPRFEHCGFECRLLMRNPYGPNHKDRLKPNLECDDFSSNRHPALSFCLSKISAQTAFEAYAAFYPRYSAIWVGRRGRGR
jgi:hypothetical protein